jgi:SPP1 family predicted phage head-tail adaptor
MASSAGYRAGQLRHRVTISLRLDVPDGFADLESTYSGQKTVWAGLFPVGGATWIGSQQTGTQITHRIVIRYLEGITSDHEITCGSRRFRIRRVSDWEERGSWTLMDCEELQR